MSAWNTLPLPPAQKEGPLWLRTQRRLARMAMWSQQRMNMSDGLDPLIQIQEEKIALAGQHLVLLLKERESNSEG